MHRLTALRELAARAMALDNNQITNSQVHNFLLAEIAKLPHTIPFMALRCAFGIGDTVIADQTLSQRRDNLSGILHKHPDTIVRYETHAINDLAAQLEASGYDVRSLDRSRMVNSSAAYRRLNMQSTIIRDTVKLSFPGLLPVANRGPELLDYLEQSQRPFLEASVDIKFAPSSRGPDWYRLNVKYMFMGVRETFRLAIVMDGEDGEQLLVQGLVDDFQKLNDTIDPRQEIRTMRNNSKFIAYNPASNSQKLFRFHELDPIQTDALLHSSSKPLKAPFRVLEVKLPAKWQGEDIVYEYHSTFNLRDDIHYAYWYAPSMMFVKKFSFDYSEFPRIDAFNFVIIPFLGNITGNSTRKKHSFVVRPNSWVMPGNGIAVVWDAKS